jgi:hypothetical protein
VPLHERGGQLAFRAPASGTYTVHLKYPRRYGLSLAAMAAFGLGLVGLARWPVSALGRTVRGHSQR